MGEWRFPEGALAEQCRASGRKSRGHPAVLGEAIGAGNAFLACSAGRRRLSEITAILAVASRGFGRSLPFWQWLPEAFGGRRRFGVAFRGFRRSPPFRQLKPNAKAIDGDD